MMAEKCEGCGAPNRKTVLRQYGWWTEITLPATVWATNGRFKYEPGTGIAMDGAFVETTESMQFIHLPWRHARQEKKGAGVIWTRSCFPNMSQHRYVTIILTVFEDQKLCQWCRFNKDSRFRRARPLLAAGEAINVTRI